MSGHSHAKNVMHKKEGGNKKKSALFGKLLKVISITAKEEPNPDFNPRLRTAIEKARSANIPLENIERAIKKISSNKENLEELVMEAYGPEGSAVLITAITDNKNRTISEIRSIITKADAKWAEPGSVLWAFDQNSETGLWSPKFPQEISSESKQKLENLISSIEENEDIQEVFTNASL